VTRAPSTPVAWPPGQRIAGLAGILFVVSSLIVIPLSPVIPPPLGSSAAEISAYYAGHGIPFLIGNYLGVAAFLPGFVQLAFLTALVRRAEGGDGWLAPLVLGTGTFAYGFGAVALTLFQALPFVIAPGMEPAVHGVAGLANVGFALFFLPASAFAGSVAWAVLSTRVLGRWLGYAGAFVALVSFVASLGALTTTPRWLAGGGVASSLALVLFFVWLLALALTFLRSSGDHSPEKT
jgi:hypothetical protein